MTVHLDLPFLALQLRDIAGSLTTDFRTQLKGENPCLLPGEGVSID